MEENIKRFMVEMGLDEYEDMACLYQDYIYECNEMIKTINNCIQDTTSSELEKLIHNLKGVSGNLYVIPVFKLTEELDCLLKTADSMAAISNQVLPIWEQVVGQYNQAIGEIKEFFQKHGESILLC